MKLSDSFSLYFYPVYVGLRTSRNSRCKRPKQCRLFCSFATVFWCMMWNFELRIPGRWSHQLIWSCWQLLLLIEFSKAIQEVWLWSRHQVTISGNRWRITAILVWKQLIKVAISNLTSDVRSREKLTWLLKCCYLHLVWCFVRFRWLGEDCKLVFLYYFIDNCFLLF